MTRFLVITDEIKGGEWIAIKRLLYLYKKTFPGVSYGYLTLKKRNEPSKRFGFVINLYRDFIFARSKIRIAIGSGDFDYILVSDYLWALASKTVKPRNVKIVFLFHGLRSILFKKLSDINYRQILIKVFERLSWAISDAIVVPSKEAHIYILKNIKNLTHYPKIYLVPNIIPANFFVERNLKKTENAFKILYSGRLGRHKGLENLIPAFSIVLSEILESQLYLTFPSSSTDRFMEKTIKSLVNKFHLAKNIKFTKDLSERKLADLYNSSDILILPSEIEFAPLSALESLASGTPVIGTNVGNLGSILQKIDSNLILRDNSPEEIAKKLVLYYRYGTTQKIRLQKVARLLAKEYSGENAAVEFNKVFSRS